LRHGRFRDAVAELAATLHGRPKDEIAGEDIRQHRRTRQITWGAVTVLFLLAVGLAIAAWIAVGQRNEAELRSNIALSRQLAAQAVSLAGSERGDLALLLGIEALRVHPTVSARNGLLTALTSDPRRRFHLHGHMGAVHSLAFTPDGIELLSLGCEGVGTLGLCEHFGVRRWDPRNGEPLGETIVPGAHRWTELAFDASTGDLVVQDQQFDRWDPTTGEELSRGAAAGIRSPDGTLTARPTRQGLVLLRGTSGQRINRALDHGEGQIRTVAFHPSEPLMVTGGSEGEVRFWSTQDILENRFAPLRIVQAHSNSVIDLDFSPDGRHLVTASWDDSVVVWDVDAGTVSRRLIEEGNVSSVVFSQDGRWLVVALSIGEQGGLLQLWKSDGWQLVTTLGGKAPIAIGPDSRLLAATGADGSVILRDLYQQRPLGAPLPRPGTPRAVTFVGNRLLAAGGRQDSLRIWNIATGTLQREPIPAGHGGIDAIAAGPNHLLVTAGSNDRLLLWDLEDPSRLSHRTIARHEGRVFALDMSIDGGRVVSGGFDNTLRVWDVATGEEVAPAFNAGTDVYEVAFDHSGARVAAATEDGSVLLWTPSDGSGRVVGTHLLQSDGMSGLAVGPSDRFLVSSSLEETQFWGLSPDEPDVRLPILGAFVALHPSGDLAAVVNDRGEIQLIDVAAWQPFDAPLGSQEELVYDIAFSPDGRTLATAARRDLVLWDVDFESWQTRACEIARRNLTQREQERYLADESYTPSCPEAPEPPAIPLNAERALGLAVRAAKLGETDKAAQLFHEAAQLASGSHDAETAHKVCWHGAVHGAPHRVLKACHHAVRLEPANGQYRDSRGIARALTDSLVAAAADFQAYLSWAEHHQNQMPVAESRQDWIDAIRDETDPFGPLVIHRLRNEEFRP
jgi:WD40 repeat protein